MIRRILIDTDLKTVNGVTLIGVGDLVVNGSTSNYTCGENIPSHTPVALVGGLAYKMSNTNPLHQFAFIGFSSVSGVTSGSILIESKLITLAAWGLTANTNYLCGVNGALITTNAASGFTKIVGFSQSTETLLIVNNYTSINKT